MEDLHGVLSIDYTVSDWNNSLYSLTTTFDRKGTHISNYAVWRFMEDGKEADSVQRQIIRRTQSIKEMNDVIGRHFVQCVTRSCEKRMISRKIPDLYHTLAKNTKVPFVRDDIKLLTYQEWAVI